MLSDLDFLIPDPCAPIDLRDTRPPADVQDGKSKPFKSLSSTLDSLSSEFIDSGTVFDPKLDSPTTLGSPNDNAANIEKFVETRNIRDYMASPSLTGRGPRVTFLRRDRTTASAVDINSDFDYDSDDGRAPKPAGEGFSITKKRPSPTDPFAVALKRPSDFDSICSTSYQPHVKTDEDIALDICNTFWRPGLTFSQYKHGARLVAFEDLWPNDESLRSLLSAAYQATSLRRSVLDITKLGLRCAPLSLIQELLNSRIVNLDQVFENGSTMLHLACIARNADVVSFLCQAGINHKSQDKYGRTAEQVCFDHRIKRLLPTSANRSVYYHSSRTPTPSPRKTPSRLDDDHVFQLAQQHKQYDDLQIRLQTLDFDVNEERNEKGEYLVHVIVRGGLCNLPQLLSLVRDQGADIDLCSSEGMTALMIASTLGNTVLVDVILCVLGSNPNGPNPLNGFCAIHYAAMYNQTDVANCLIKRGADYNLEDHSGQRADDIARFYRSHEFEEFIVTERHSRVDYLADLVMNGLLKAQELRVTDLYQLTKDGETLIMLAAKYNRTNNLKILIVREGCPIDAQHGITGRTALTMACVNGHSNSVQILMQHDANASLKDVDGLLPVHHIVINDEWEVAEIVLQYSRALIGLHIAKRNARSPKMRELLRVALQRRQSELVTPALFEMSLTGDAQSLYCLLEEGDDVNPMSGVGNWPLYLAAEYGHLDVVKLLHHFGGEITKKHPSTRNTILHIACERGHYHIVHFVLKFASNRPSEGQLDINGLNVEGKIPLHSASEKGSRKTVSLLLDRGASTAVPDAEGKLIHSPQYLGVQFLIENRREEHTRNISMALRDKKDIRKLHDLFETRFDHNLRDARGDSPLMVACKYGNFLAVKYLLMSALNSNEGVASPDSDADSGISAAIGGRQRTASESVHEEMDDEGPGWMLASTGHMDSTTSARKRGNLRNYAALAHSQYLLEEDQFESRIRPRVHSRSTLNLGSDDDDLTSHDIFALSLGESHVSDINPLDGRAAIHRAIEHGDEVNIVLALAEADRNCVNIQDNNGFSPMHLACRLSRRKIVQKLVKMSFVDLNLRTLDGKLPEEMTSSRQLVNSVLVNRRGERRMSSVVANSASNVGFNDSASQTGKSTVLDLDDLNDKFNRLRSKVFRKDSSQ